MLIGITGSIGSGKTTVAALLGSLLQAPVLNADQICREQLEFGRQGYREFVDCFGDRFLDSSLTIDRPQLRGAVFTDESVRCRLEAILHPIVRATLQRARQQAAGRGLVLAEVPLLFEVGWLDDFDMIVVVDVSEELILARVAARDGITEDGVRGVLAAQLPAAYKRSHADAVIDNSAGWAETKRQVRDLAVRLRQCAEAASQPDNALKDLTPSR